MGIWPGPSMTQGTSFQPGHEAWLKETVTPAITDMDLLCPHGSPLLSFGPQLAVLAALFSLVLVDVGS